jgi:hypothetical protein
MPESPLNCLLTALSLQETNRLNRPPLRIYYHALFAALECCSCKCFFCVSDRVASSCRSGSRGRELSAFQWARFARFGSDRLQNGSSRRRAGSLGRRRFHSKRTHLPRLYPRDRLAAAEGGEVRQRDLFSLPKAGGGERTGRIAIRSTSSRATKEPVCVCRVRRTRAW